MVSAGTWLRQQAQRKAAAKKKKSVQEELKRKYGEGTPEYYEAYNRYLYGEEQWEFIKSSKDGTSEAGAYVSHETVYVDEYGQGVSIDPSLVHAATIEAEPQGINVLEAARAPDVSARIVSPQETVMVGPRYMGRTPATQARDTIGPGEGYEPVQGGGWGLISREEAMSQVPPGGAPSGISYNVTAVQEARDAIVGRFVSPQETVSVESELLMEQERARGRAQIEAPLEASRKVSEIIVGPVENIPRSETVPRGVASAVEWAVTLPAETLRSPVTITETAQEMRELGVIRTIQEGAYAISQDPSGAGVKAGLTAALLALPAAKFVVRGARGLRTPGRTTPSYEVALGPEDLRTARADYISDFIFKPEGEALRGKGQVLVRAEGAQAWVDVDSLTVPERRGFKTTVRARRVARSRMDLGQADEIVGTSFSEETALGSKSRGRFLRTREEGQLDLLGRPVPKQELAVRADTALETPDLDIMIGRRASRKSSLNMQLQESVDVSGTKLLFESRQGEVLRRKTFTREASVPEKTFTDKYFDRVLLDLGVKQESLRFHLEIGKTMVTPEEALQAGIEAGLIKFYEIEKFRDTRQLGEFRPFEQHGRIRILRSLSGPERTSVIAHELGHFMKWLEGNLDYEYTLKSAYSKLYRERARIIRDQGPEAWERIEKRMDRDPKYANRVFNRLRKFGEERMELRAEKFENLIMEKGGFRKNALGRITLQSNIYNTKGLAMAERAMRQAASSFTKTGIRELRQQTSSVAPKTAQAEVRGPRPSSGLGGIPWKAKAKPIEEEVQILKYPPSEGPELLREGSLNVFDVGLKTNMEVNLAMLQAPSQRSRSRGALTLGMDLEAAQATAVAQMVGQGQAQRLSLVTLTGQRTATRTRFRLPPFTPRPGTSERLIFRPTDITGRGPPLLLPPFIIPGGEPMRPRVSRFILPGPRGFKYTPTLGGLFSGREIGAAPGQLSGLEIRFPVGGEGMAKKKRKKKR